MADKKFPDAFTQANTFSADSVVLVVNYDLAGNPTTCATTVGGVFANVNSVSANTIAIFSSLTPNTSSDAVSGGLVWFDANYLYVSVANNAIKRVALESF